MYRDIDYERLASSDIVITDSIEYRERSLISETLAWALVAFLEFSLRCSASEPHMHKVSDNFKLRITHDIHRFFIFSRVIIFLEVVHGLISREHRRAHDFSNSGCVAGDETPRWE